MQGKSKHLISQVFKILSKHPNRAPEIHSRLCISLEFQDKVRWRIKCRFWLTFPQSHPMLKLKITGECMFHRLLVILSLIHYTQVAAQNKNSWSFKSGVVNTKLLELYTSQGCSSCPPIEKWINSFDKKAPTFQKFIPIVFHVDYWDYLGWKDKFSKRKYSNRQRFIARRWNSKSIYTPGLVLNGQEFRANNKALLTPAQKAPRIQLNVRKIENDLFEAKLTVNKKNKLKFSHCVLMLHDFEQQITEGENVGRKLHHDFVIIDWQQKGIENNVQAFKLRIKKDFRNFKALSVAAWLEDQRGVPVQAVGGYLNNL